jgi:adenylate cyclase, class 2
MPLEIEVKYLDADHAALRKRLEALGARFVGRWFESNIVFDDAARSLKASGTLLRLREHSGRHILTLKRAASALASAEAKICEEHETGVADTKAMAEILAGLGYAPALRYEKIRETWSLSGCEVCLDTLPFGLFVEIEGGEADIASCASGLGLPRDKASTATYHDLNQAHRQARGEAPDESFVFDAAVKARLLARRATDPDAGAPLDNRPRSA